MSSNKRRKLEPASEAAPLSAFAARRALKVEHAGPAAKNQGVENANGSGASNSPLSVNAPKLVHGAASSIRDDLDAQTVPSTSGKELAVEVDESLSPSVSRAESPEAPLERPSITLSTFKPSTDTVRKLANGKVLLKIAPGERIVILGRFDICVQEGRITILGATLPKSPTVHRVHASSSHALPVIRCPATDISGAMVSLRQCEDGLELLEPLSPLFGKLWNDRFGPLGPERSFLSSTSSKRSSFQILFSSDDGPKKVYLQPIISPPEWNEALSSLSKKTDQKNPIVMICGPKSSGKSTFAKLFTNRLLSSTADTAKGETLNAIPQVALLDLDPGQPEYSTPGQLSLVHLQEPNFGPPYSHPIPGNTSKVIRAHTIAAVSPSLDPNLYMACVLDLFAHYQTLSQKGPNYPLVINTPGWVFGTGLEILEELIARLKPTDVVYMSNEGPVEVTKSLRDAAKKIPLLELPSQTSEYTTRTAAHLRTMQNMSYFHLDLNTDKALNWNGLPLTSVPPWEIRYSGEEAGVLGIMCYGEQPPVDLLADAINGSLVAVVVVDDKGAIAGWETEESAARNDTEILHDYNMELENAELRAFDDKLQQSRAVERPLIVRTPIEDLPYFNPTNVNSLNPSHSHTIGLALVRGIDITRHRIQVLTPISPAEIEGINEAGKSIVLVSGKFDTPGWAYVEELIQKGTMDKAARRKETAGIVSNRKDEWDGVDLERVLGDGFENAPWIERLEGSEGRGVGARVWRVRRDLGRTGDGGE